MNMTQRGLYFALVICMVFISLCGYFVDVMAVYYLNVDESSDVLSSSNNATVRQFKMHSVINKSKRKYPGIPSLISIGPEKCGTTSFGKILEQFEEIIVPSTSPIGIELEIRMWLNCGNRDLNYTYHRILNATSFKDHCSMKWYKHFWQIKYDDIRNSKKNGKKSRFYYYFEKSPAYWYYEHVAFVFKHFLIPLENTKFVILLRNPLKRLFSYFVLQYSLHQIITIDFEDFIEQSLNNKYIQLMDKELSNREYDKEKLMNLWRMYIYKNGANYISVNGQYKYDTNPWSSFGGSCYIVPLLMWLQYIPIKRIKIIQMESLYKSKVDAFESLNLLRCWLSIEYEYDGDLDHCLNDKRTNATIYHLRSVSHFAKSRNVNMIDDSSKVYHEYRIFFKQCNQRLQDLFAEQQYKQLQLSEFEWDLWRFDE